ncbi:hypothetical protein Fot_13204 [Forsythia ovata]|uniref:Uncharacterized protein n=1 Tax=Forsythia ovata TaxID=205694 RepID=A0ABD1W2W3_9LAMI
MAEDILENGLKKMESVLRVIKIEEVNISKEIEIDSRDDEEKIDDQSWESNPLHALDLPCVKTKGITNTRLKSQVKKKRRKCKKMIQPTTHEFDNIEKARNQKFASVQKVKNQKLKGAI